MHHTIVDMKQFRNTQYIVYEDGRIFNTITKRWITPYLGSNNKARKSIYLLVYILTIYVKTFCCIDY